MAFFGFITLFSLSWILYFFIDPAFTFLIILVHYTSLFFLSYVLWIEKKKTIPFIIGLYLGSVFLDLLYNHYHQFQYSIFYYATVNLIHILFLLIMYGFINYKNRILILSSLILFLINLYIWIYLVNFIIILFFIDIVFIILYFNSGKIEKIYL
jgi:hypothetical protein